MDDILARSAIAPLTGKTITDPAEIRAKIELARIDGYAVALEEILVGEVVLAAPVLDAAGRPVGAVHIAGSLGEWTATDFCARFAPLAAEAARAISH